MVQWSFVSLFKKKILLRITFWVIMINLCHKIFYTTPLKDQNCSSVWFSPLTANHVHFALLMAIFQTITLISCVWVTRSFASFQYNAYINLPRLESYMRQAIHYTFYCMWGNSFKSFKIWRAGAFMAACDTQDFIVTSPKYFVLISYVVRKINHSQKSKNKKEGC